MDVPASPGDGNLWPADGGAVVHRGIEPEQPPADANARRAVRLADRPAAITSATGAPIHDRFAAGYFA